MKPLSLASLLLTWLNVSVTQHVSKIQYKGDQSTKFTALTSNRPRSPFTAKRLNFNWNDLVADTLSKPNTSSAVISIGTGYPDYSPPQYLLDALEMVAKNQTEIDSWTIHQYTRPMGDPRLVRSVAKFFSMLMNRSINPDREVLITMGAQHSLNAAFRALLDPGDECIVFEPRYFLYEPLLKLSGAVAVYVPLRPKNGTKGQYSQDWSFDCLELEKKINGKTKMILLNNPNNPYGKVYTLDELKFIGELAEKYNLVIVSDEVEQFYIYDEPQHIRIATLPGLWKRTLTITSGGKLFSNTGWRIGWTIGPEDLLWGLRVVVATEVINVATPLQLAFAIGLDIEYKLYDTENSFVGWVRDETRKSRNRMAAILKSIGTDVIVPAAGYSIVANFARITDQINLSDETDLRPGFRMANWLSRNAQIDSLAASTFYSPKNFWKTEYILRFVLIKSEQLVNEFGRRITTLFRHINESEYEKQLTHVNPLAPED